jgi:hypothetical protein
MELYFVFLINRIFRLETIPVKYTNSFITKTFSFKIII